MYRYSVMTKRLATLHHIPGQGFPAMAVLIVNKGGNALSDLELPLALFGLPTASTDGAHGITYGCVAI